MNPAEITALADELKTAVKRLDMLRIGCSVPGGPMYILSRGRDEIADALGLVLDALAASDAKADALLKAIGAIEQTAGKALGYPWFKDDQKNFPVATEADGVCIGEHIAETIVEELAAAYTALLAERDSGFISVGYQYGFRDPFTGARVWRESDRLWNGQRHDAAREFFARAALSPAPNEASPPPSTDQPGDGPGTCRVIKHTVALGFRPLHAVKASAEPTPPPAPAITREELVEMLNAHLDVDYSWVRPKIDDTSIGQAADAILARLGETK